MDSEPTARPAFSTLLKEKGFWLLNLAGILFFFRPLFLDETFFFRDLYKAHLPFQTQWAEMIRSGEIPLWNPLFHGGIPFLAEINMTALYPGHLLGLVLEPTSALTLNIVLHLLAAAGSAYLLARVLGLSSASAFVAGSVFGYCGFTLSQVNLIIRLQGVPYLALHILFWHLFLVERRRRFFLAATCCGVLQVFSGSPTLFVPTLCLSLIWGLALAETGFPWRRGILWVILVAAVVGLAAPQILPTVELIGQSSRGTGTSYEAFSQWSIHPGRLLAFLFPGFLGPIDTLTDATIYWGAPLVDLGFPYMLGLYISGITLVLALLGAFAEAAPERRLRRVLLGLSGVALLLSLGRYLPFFELLYKFVPGISLFRFPVKFLIFALLPMALLAAYGTETAFSEAPGDRKKVKKMLMLAWVILGLPALLLLASAGRVAEFLFQQREAADGIFASVSQALAFWLLATLLGVLGQRRWGPAGAWTLSAVVLADLLLAGHGLNPTVPTKMLTQVPEAAQLVRSEVGDGRFFRTLPPETYGLDLPSDNIIWLYRWHQEVLNDYLGVSYGIPMIFHVDFDSLEPLRTKTLTEMLKVLPWESRWPALDAAAVTVLMSHEELERSALTKIATINNASGIPMHIYRNSGAARRLEWIGVWQTAPSERDARVMLLAPGFDPRQHAVLEAPIEGRARRACDGGARVELREAQPSRRVYSVDAPCDGLVVLAETFYPGREIWIDGRKAPLWRANLAFMAAPIEEGEHEVVLRFVPRSFYVGLAIGMVTLFLLIGLLFVGQSWDRIFSKKARLNLRY